MIKQITAASLLAFAAMSVYAQEEPHAHSDIGGHVDGLGSQIEVEGGEPLIAGGFVFEGDFGDAELGDYATEDPGFDIDGFTPGEFLSLEVKSGLQFWNGSAWGLASTGLADSATVDILNDTFTATLLSVTGGPAPTGLAGIGAADGDGEVHEHLGFAINATAATGSYMLELALRGFGSEGGSEIYTTSDSFFLVLNNGLSEVAFEESVEALGISEVPLPAAAWFMLSALGSLVAARRMRG